MGKNRNRQRREARAAKSEPPREAPVLRLVRPDEGGVSPEPDAAGLASTAVDRVPEQGRGDRLRRPEESRRDVVAATDAGTGHIERSFDAEEINRIINDPNVFPLVSVPGVDHIDVSGFVADPRNVLMMAEGGGILFIQDEPGIYEVHTNFLREYRGHHAIAASLAAYRWMFTHTDCMSIATRIPAFNRPAAFAARKAGFEPLFERKALWPTAKGPVDLRFYEIDYRRWLTIDAKALIEAGRGFHTHLEQEFARHDAKDEPHPDEDCHDLNVGACVETIYGGQPEKAVVLYNRWARLAGYGQISLIARSPMMIDIGTALLLVADNSFKIVKAR